MNSDVGVASTSQRSSRIHIDIDALKHNLSCIRSMVPDSRIMAVIKADAYGHNALLTAKALDQADAFALATVGEAVALRHAGISQPMVVLQGFANIDELRLMAEFDIQPVIHSLSQIELLETSSGVCLNVWLKIDTGMHRLGLALSDIDQACRRLSECKQVGELRLMSHFANADDVGNAINNNQLSEFIKVINRYDFESSMANSAALLTIPESHLDWVRPGIMLYGSSPLHDRSVADLGLKPVMNFESHIIAVNHLKRGNVIGYGSRWECPEDMPVGIVATGYADGYPRHAVSGTPVWVNQHKCSLLGRVSMDSLCIDLRGIEAEPGDRVVLWGHELSVDEVAKGASTISYEILCHAGSAIDMA